jgi:hypothetical protein
MEKRPDDAQMAAFEAGIKLGALYHQFTGSPLNLQNVDSLEKAIAESISVQPFVEEINVTVNRDIIAEKLNGEFGYCELEGKMLTVYLVVIHENTRIRASMKYNKELDYPLMKINEIESLS